MDYAGKIINKNPVTPSQTSASGVWTVDDVAAAVRTNTWPVAGVPNPISKSLRFNSADSAYLNRTPASAGNRDTWTWSAWVKRSALSNSVLFFAGTLGSNDTGIYFGGSNNLDFYTRTSSSTLGYITTPAVFRDVSAWYHIVAVYDSGNATSADRMILYVNGTRQTVTVVNTLPQNTDSFINSNVAHQIGSYGSDYLNGYLTEVNFIDGQALTPSSFGMTDPVTGVWEPLKYSGAYGTNGFYLNFKDATSTTTLGLDYSGNSNTWTTNNFSVTAGAGNDSMTDVPTPWIVYNTTGDIGGVVRGNYCTLNPISGDAASYGYLNTLTDGNLKATAPATSAGSSGTIFVNSGKWYFESTIALVSAAGVQFSGIGVVPYNGTYLRAYAQDGNYYNGTSWVAYGATYTTNDIIGCAFDLDNQTITFYKNGVSQGQKTSIGLSGITLTPIVYNYTSSSSQVLNFGQRPFAYTPPSGFLSLCTTNLPASTIVAGNQYFDATLYTGAGAVQSVTNSGSMQPDLVWLKSRSNAYSHYLYDAIRGVGNSISSDSTGAEQSFANSLTAFNSNGFSLGNIGGAINQSGSTFVAWQWKANGAGVTNTAGSITSTVSANTTSGFSIVTYTGTGALATVGHGLGVTPSMIIVKRRDSTGDWGVYHSSVSGGANNQLLLNSTAAAPGSSTFWGNLPTSTVFSVWTSATTNANTGTYVAYCFAAISGFSAFGSYTGNASTDGPFVYLGFRPRFVMWKNTTTAGYNWEIIDTARDTYNVMLNVLGPNSSAAESAFAGPPYLDAVSNGFKIRTGSASSGYQNINNNNDTYIYAAFAENPFKNALAR